MKSHSHSQMLQTTLWLSCVGDTCHWSLKALVHLSQPCSPQTWQSLPPCGSPSGAHFRICRFSADPDSSPRTAIEHSSGALNLLCSQNAFILDLPGGSNGEESACSAGDPGSIPGLGRSPGEGDGYPFQYSCLKNSMDRGAWQVTVHGVANNWTWLSNFNYLFILEMKWV